MDDRKKIQNPMSIAMICSARHTSKDLESVAKETLNITAFIRGVTFMSYERCTALYLFPCSFNSSRPLRLVSADLNSSLHKMLPSCVIICLLMSDVPSPCSISLTCKAKQSAA